jgi:hypothetical protein
MFITNCFEEFEDTKGIIRIRISKKNSQHNGQKKNDKCINPTNNESHVVVSCLQARSSLYANTQLRAHRRAENKNKEKKKKN